jgi:hypothetical protein
MKQNYTLYVYKTDRRYKSGERAIRTEVVPNITKSHMAGTVIELYDTTYPVSQGYRIEYFPTMKTVKNLMTGKDIEIDRDTPYCCDPSSERFWSM